MTNKILFYSPNEDIESNSVVRSQIIGFAKYLTSLNFSILIVTCDFRRTNGNRVKTYLFEDTKIQIVRISHPERKVPLLTPIVNSFRVYKKSYQDIINFKPTHIYFRDPFCFYEVIKLNRITHAKKIFSLRGIVSHESLMLYKGIRKYFLFAISHFFVSKAIQNSDSINSVSESMQLWILKRYKVNSIILPSCVSEDYFNKARIKRATIRLKLKISESDKVFCYCGGLSEWQRINDILIYFNKLNSYNKNWKFLFLVDDCNRLSKLIRNIGLPFDNVILLRVANTEIGDYIASADIGIIFRNKSIVNKVSSPLKIGEYLSSGLFVLLSPNIGDYSDLIDKYECGLVINKNTEIHNTINYLDNLSFTNTFEKSRKLANEYCRWISWKDNIYQLFA